MDKFRCIFGVVKPAIVGMIHVQALPGSPRNSLSMSDIVSRAREEADIYVSSRVNGLLIENMHDIPWNRPDQLGPETVAAMTAVCCAIRHDHPSIPVGVQVLSSANRAALAVAKASGLNFVRAEGWVFAHVGDEGYTESCAADLTRYRKHVSADGVLIFTDIKKKHSAHALTADVSIEHTAHAAELFLSDGLIVTGASTGIATDVRDLHNVQKATGGRIPVLVGSGVDIDNVHNYLTADALIIGSHFKTDGLWSRSLDRARISSFMDRLSHLQRS